MLSIEDFPRYFQWYYHYRESYYHRFGTLEQKS